MLSSRLLNWPNLRRGLALTAAVTLAGIVQASTPIKTLSPPKHFDATDGFNTGIRLSWNPSPNATYYDIYRGTSRLFSKATLRAVSKIKRFNDRQTNSGVYYYYWIAARAPNRTSDIVGPIRGLRGETARFLMQPKDVLAHEGTPVDITAKVAGFPTPKCEWFKGSRPLGKSNHLSGTHLPTLHFNKLLPSDAGFYYLHIYNIAGGVKSRPVKVEVILN
jgi:hypothetical protein